MASVGAALSAAGLDFRARLIDLGHCLQCAVRVFDILVEWIEWG